MLKLEQVNVSVKSDTDLMKELRFARLTYVTTLPLVIFLFCLVLYMKFTFILLMAILIAFINLISLIVMQSNIIRLEVRNK